MTTSQLMYEPQATTPYVRVDYRDQLLEIKGRSVPENSLEFYQPILNHVAGVIDSGEKKFTANFQLLYFNTSSARCIFLLIKELKKLEEAGVEVTINWFVDESDEDMIETGEDYRDIVGMDFNIKILPDDHD